MCSARTSQTLVAHFTSFTLVALTSCTNRCSVDRLFWFVRVCYSMSTPPVLPYVGPHGLTPGWYRDRLVLCRFRPSAVRGCRQAYPIRWVGGSAFYQPRCGGLQYAARHISGPVHLGGLGGATLARQVPRRGVTHILVCFPFLVKAYYIQNGIPYTVIIGSALLFILVAVSVSALRGHPVWTGGGRASAPAGRAHTSHRSRRCRQPDGPALLPCSHFFVPRAFAPSSPASTAGVPGNPLWGRTNREPLGSRWRNPLQGR